MSSTGACRFRTDRPICRHLKIQRAIAGKPDEMTTRLSEKVSGLSITDLGGGLIKGLFVLPVTRVPTDQQKKEQPLEERFYSSCQRGFPLVVFGIPTPHGDGGDFQHIDLARKLGLTREKLLPEREQKFTGEIFGSEEPQPGVWGFVLHKLRFDGNSNANKTSIEREAESGYKSTIVLTAETFSELVDPQTGEVNLVKMTDIWSSTAKMLSTVNLYAFLFRAAREKDTEVWGVYAESGATGGIPEIAVTSFLMTLALHVAPDFKVFQFITDGKFFFSRGIITPTWREARFPNCLQWPDGMQLEVNPEPPEGWWGG